MNRILDRRGTTSPLSKQIRRVQQELQPCFFTAVDPINVSILNPRFEPGLQGIVPYILTWERSQDAFHWFDLKVAKDKGLVFCHTIFNAITLFESVPASSSVQVDTRYLDDTEAEILHQKRCLNQKRLVASC